MSVGPIEFEDGEAHVELPPSEFGGSGGLIAPAVTPMGGPGHDLLAPGAASVRTSSEVHGMINRVRGDEPEDVEIVDESGRSVTPDLHEAGTSPLSDLKP